MAVWVSLFCSHDAVMDLHIRERYFPAGQVRGSILSNCYICHRPCHSFGNWFSHTEISSTCLQSHGSNSQAILNTADSLHCHICHCNKPLLVWIIYMEGEMYLYIQFNALVCLCCWVCLNNDSCLQNLFVFWDLLLYKPVCCSLTNTYLIETSLFRFFRILFTVNISVHK